MSRLALALRLTAIASIVYLGVTYKKPAFYSCTKWVQRTAACVYNVYLGPHVVKTGQVCLVDDDEDCGYWRCEGEWIRVPDVP